MGIIFLILFSLPGFALGIMTHESAHALAALKLGDPTARNMGRISLDPRRHFDALGAILYVVMLMATRGGFAFGWAKPVPINRYNFRDPRRDFMLSSLAGPASNLAQALVWALLLRLYSALVRLPLSLVFSRASDAAQDPVGFMITFGIIINIALAVFNLIPIPPLDGSRVLAWMLPEPVASGMDRLEPYGFMILIAALYFGLFGVVFRAVGAPILLFLLRAMGG
jgi:Zn-dependent protease